MDTVWLSQLYHGGELNVIGSGSSVDNEVSGGRIVGHGE